MEISEEIKSEIRRMAVRNALDYGKAEPGVVLNRVLSRFPELRGDINALSKAVLPIVDSINSLGRQELETEAGRYSADFAAEKARKLERTAKPNFALDGAVNGAFATRFPPAPNGYMHIGHAKVAFIESISAQAYSGTMALYFDDTNPEKDRQEFVDEIKKGLEWLGISFDSEYYASDNLQLLYRCAGKLISDGNAYVCSCTGEEVKKGRIAGKGCDHKAQETQRNMELWDDMLGGKFEENGAILRLNSDMNADNTTLRDPTLFRIKKTTHYRQGDKYSVWPTYDINTPVIDSTKGITDVIRSKEFELRDELYFRVLNLLGMRKPRIHSVARLEIKGNITSKRRLNELIARKLIWGYDDPRLVTIAGLRRRGILPEAIKNLVLKFGLSKAERETDMGELLAENRRLIDGTAKRLFFIANPVRISVTGIPTDKLTARMRLHPKNELGFREYSLSGTFLISAPEAESISEGDIVQLKTLFNITIDSKGESGIEAHYASGGSPGPVKLAWIDAENSRQAHLYTIGDLLEGEEFNAESMIQTDGFIEAYVDYLNRGDVVQFEKVGFFKLDDKTGMRFISM